MGKFCIVEAVNRVCIFTEGYLVISEKNVQNKENPLVGFALLGRGRMLRLLVALMKWLIMGSLISRPVNHKVPGDRSIRY